MNCKPGDLAVIVLPHETNRNLGKLVHVLSVAAVLGDGWWRVESLSPAHLVTGKMSSAGFVHDSRLRPIRDPGDDAVDETLLWAGSPALAEFLRSTSPL